MPRFLNSSATNQSLMNLYDFSQVNDNDMGAFVDRDQETDPYRKTREQAQRLIRVSDEVRLSVEKVEQPKDERRESAAGFAKDDGFDKLTSSKLAKAFGLRKRELGDKHMHGGLTERDGERSELSAKAKAAGAKSGRPGSLGHIFCGSRICVSHRAVRREVISPMILDLLHPSNIKGLVFGQRGMEKIIV